MIFLKIEYVFDVYLLRYLAVLATIFAHLMSNFEPDLILELTPLYHLGLVGKQLSLSYFREYLLTALFQKFQSNNVVFETDKWEVLLSYSGLTQYRYI